MSDQKSEAVDIRPVSADAEFGVTEKIVEGSNEFEVFRKGEGVVDFRTVPWYHASIIFLKIIFATGVLSIPSAMNQLGAFPGAVTVIGLTLLNGYCAIVLGDFRRNHAGCHSIADMALLVGGPVTKEITGFLFLAAYVVCSASGIIGVSTAFNALSDHAICTMWFSVVATVIVALAASVRKFEKVAWLTWVGFGSVFVAVMIVVVGVSVRDRPALAPQTGDFDLGFKAIGSPTFIAGMTSTATILCSSAATAAFLPVISEMKKPRDYNKAVYVCMGLVTASYFAFSFVVYWYCGQWVASPSLGSAGGSIKKVAYGVGIAGLAVSACLYVHIGAKYLFVRILRRSRHLQENTVVHWATWLACTVGISIASFLIASGVPIFSYILALAGSFCFAPVALCLPGWLWCHDHAGHRKGNMWQVVLYGLHVLLILFGVFITIGGTYSVIREIVDAYASGEIGAAFSCADNSATVLAG